jgi:ATP-dependent RNA helicase RhlE
MDLFNNKGVSTALVFTRTKHGADQVARLIEKKGIKTMAIHGNKSQSARQAALEKFKDGRISVLVATDIAARGIDISGLPFVINYNVPEEAESYVHRIGRTGRAGLDGTAITFCCDEELSNLRSIEKLIGKSIPVKTCEWSITDIKESTQRITKAQQKPSERAVGKQSARFKGNIKGRKNSSRKF